MQAAPLSMGWKGAQGQPQAGARMGEEEFKGQSGTLMGREVAGAVKRGEEAPQAREVGQGAGAGVFREGRQTGARACVGG